MDSKIKITLKLINPRIKPIKLATGSAACSWSTGRNMGIDWFRGLYHCVFFS